jgi:hypothetical protein
MVSPRAANSEHNLLYRGTSFSPGGRNGLASGGFGVHSSSDPEAGVASILAHEPPGATARGAPLALDLNGKLGWTAALAIGAAYVAFFVQLTSFPLQDYPNHVARGAVMADLFFHHGARFGEQFAVQPMPVPYILGDLLLAASMELFGTSGGAGVFTALVLLSLPCALLLYMNVNRLAPRARPFVFLLSLYLSTDWFFLMGFMAFRLSIAALVATLALADLLRRRWSVPMFWVFLAALVLSYLIHLTWLVFFAVVLGVSAVVRWWFGTTSARREIWLFVPVLALLAWQFGFVQTVLPQGAGASPLYQPEWGSLAQKLNGFLMEFGGFGGHLAEPMIVMLIVCLFWPVRHALRRHRWISNPEVLEQLAIAAAFLALYFILPRDRNYIAFVDIRALPIVVLFVIFTVLRMPAGASGGSAFATGPVFALAMLLATGNLAYLAFHVGQDNAGLARYRALVRSVPEGASVLSVYAGPQATLRPFLHAGAFAVLDRGSITPYLFAGNWGDPMLYFRYRHPTYRPPEMWYDAQRLRNLAATSAQPGSQWTNRAEPADGHRPWYEITAAPDWGRIGCNYDFLLITLPFDRSSIGLATRTVAMNQSAALLKIDTDKQGCPR